MPTSNNHHPSRDIHRRSVLTQHECDVLCTALDQGYYDVPRGVTLSDLADEFDMTDVEVSEQLRQGTKTLLRDYRDKM
jgi:hypothetical protein